MSIPNICIGNCPSVNFARYDPGNFAPPAPTFTPPPPIIPDITSTIMSGIGGFNHLPQAIATGGPQYSSLLHGDRIANAASLASRIPGVQISMDQGLNNVFGVPRNTTQNLGYANRRPDLIYTVDGQRYFGFEMESRSQVSGRRHTEFLRAIRDTEDVGAHLGRSVTVQSVPWNSSTRALSLAATVEQGLLKAKVPLLGLEISSHVYDVAVSEDRITATARAGGSMLGGRIGAHVGAAACVAHPVGAFVCGFVGAIAGSGLGGEAFGRAADILQNQPYSWDNLVSATKEAFNFVGNQGKEWLQSVKSFLEEAGTDAKTALLSMWDGIRQRVIGGVDLGITLQFSDYWARGGGTEELIIDPPANLAVALLPSSSSPASRPVLSLDVIATLLRLEYFYDGHAAFSLDCYADNFSEMYKTFHPISLGGTELGEILFRADVLLKRLTLGLEVPPLPNWVDLIYPEESAETSTEDGMVHRWWISPSKAVVRLRRAAEGETAQLVTLDPIVVTIQCQRQCRDPSTKWGLADDGAPDLHGQALAQMFTDRWQELRDYYPIFKVLDEVYRVAAMVKLFKFCGYTCDYAWVHMFGCPKFETPGRFSALTNKKEIVTSTKTINRTSVGGCIALSPDFILDIRQEVDPNVREKINLATQCREHRMYRPGGRRLREEADDVSQSVDTLTGWIQSSDPTTTDQTLELHIPSIPEGELDPGTRLPFLGPGASRCGLCERELRMPLSPNGGMGDPIRYQTYTGIPVCSRIHSETHPTPVIRMTRPTVCAKCACLLDGPYATVSFVDRDAEDYCRGCCPLLSDDSTAVVQGRTVGGADVPDSPDELRKRRLAFFANVDGPSAEPPAAALGSNPLLPIRQANESQGRTLGGAAAPATDMDLRERRAEHFPTQPTTQRSPAPPPVQAAAVAPATSMEVDGSEPHSGRYPPFLSVEGSPLAKCNGAFVLVHIMDRKPRYRHLTEAVLILHLNQEGTPPGWRIAAITTGTNARCLAIGQDSPLPTSCPAWSILDNNALVSTDTLQVVPCRQPPFTGSNVVMVGPDSRLTGVYVPWGPHEGRTTYSRGESLFLRHQEALGNPSWVITEAISADTALAISPSTSTSPDHSPNWLVGSGSDLNLLTNIACRRLAELGRHCLHVTGLPSVLGRYVEEGQHHGRPLYRRETLGPARYLYYWNEAGPFLGWWFCEEVGGDQFNAFSRGDQAAEPTQCSQWEAMQNVMALRGPSPIGGVYVPGKELHNGRQWYTLPNTDWVLYFSASPDRPEFRGWWVGSGLETERVLAFSADDVPTPDLCTWQLQGSITITGSCDMSALVPTVQQARACVPTPIEICDTC